MKIEITAEEKTALLKFATKNKLRTKDDYVDPLNNSKESMEFVRNFLKRRNIKNPKVYEEGIYAFRNVGMHTDHISPKSAMTICLMVSGGGELHSWDGKKINTFRLQKGEGAFFDFNLPHSFETRQLCQAFLVDIPKKYRQNLKHD